MSGLNTYDAIVAGANGGDPIADTATHTAGAGISTGTGEEYLGFTEWMFFQCYEDTVFHADTERSKASAVLAGETYPKGALVPGPFTVIRLQSGFGEAIRRG